MDEHSPVFAIAMAAELAGMHPQTLRQYDRIGLVSPRRTAGKSRRYSMRDIAQLKTVSRLSNEGVSLEGIARLLSLENQVDALTRRVRELESALANEMLKSPGRRVFAAGQAGDVISLRNGVRTQRRTELVVWRPDAAFFAEDEDIEDSEGDLDEDFEAEFPGGPARA
ncbi:MerR family transcriptional regulator [Mycetocola lacteus]|uniref:MerR family transcriptional regulator n=1 Tax=Mycetocola lacteus TaxID=76637 RepID=A0A3L7AUC5_9MICO|nr:MerR family transcriptional regulator [Mycetocola lacteus]RLP84123.1 MerR family transcriptional regulator [Mycetocola lacteus]